MGRKATVEKLPDDQFDFVIRSINDGLTDREISAAFEKEFKKALPKSSLNTWRNIHGNELAERYRLKRYQVRTFVETLKAEGVDVSDDKYKAAIESVEDQLLTNERELLAANPVKLLGLRQEEERLRIKREQIALNQSKLDFEKHKHEREASIRVDRLAIGADVWKVILFFMSEHEPHVADVLTRRSSDVLAAIEGHLTNEAA